jgi:hypothetical protein
VLTLIVVAWNSAIKESAWAQGSRQLAQEEARERANAERLARQGQRSQALAAAQRALQAKKRRTGIAVNSPEDNKWLSRIRNGLGGQRAGRVPVPTQRPNANNTARPHPTAPSANYSERLLAEETKLRADAEGFRKLGRNSSALRAARRALDVYQQRTNRPPSAKDRRWLTDLQNEFVRATGFLSEEHLRLAMAMEFKDKWLTKEEEVHAGGVMSAKIAADKLKLRSLPAADTEARKAQQESIASSEQNRAKLIEKLAKYIGYRNRYYFEGDFDQASTYASFVIKMKTEIYGKDDLTTAVSIAERARVFQRQGRFLGASQLFTESLEILNRIFPSDHWRVSDATTSVKESVLLRRKGFTDTRDRAFQTRSNAFKVRTLLSGGDYYNALKITREDVNFFKFSLKEPTTYYALTLTNLATIHRALGRYSDAVPAQREALAMIEKVFQPAHPDYIDALNRLVVMYISLGDIDRAIETARRSLKLSETVWGLKHGETALAYGSWPNRCWNPVTSTRRVRCSSARCKPTSGTSAATMWNGRIRCTAWPLPTANLAAWKKRSGCLPTCSRIGEVRAKATGHDTSKI